MLLAWPTGRRFRRRRRRRRRPDPAAGSWAAEAVAGLG